MEYKIVTHNNTCQDNILTNEYKLSKESYQSWLSCRLALEDMAIRDLIALKGNGYYNFHYSKSNRYGYAPEGLFLATKSNKIHILEKQSCMLSTHIKRIKTYRIVKCVAEMPDPIAIDLIDPKYYDNIKEIVDEIHSEVKKIEPTEKEVQSNNSQ